MSLADKLDDDYDVEEVEEAGHALEMVPLIPFKKPDICKGDTNIMILGATGVGKSALCNFICRVLDQTNPNYYVESAQAFSCTTDPDARVVGGFRIVDSPGLLDTKGIDVDQQNISKIILYSKMAGYLNCILILVNYFQPRFDHAILDAIKLYFDSFGLELMSRMGILYTKFKFSEANIKNLGKLTGQYQQLINERCGCNLANIPFWFVDCHPEHLAIDEVPLSRIKSVAEQSSLKVHEMLMWAITKSDFPTADVGKNLIIKTEIETQIREIKRSISDEVVKGTTKTYRLVDVTIPDEEETKKAQEREDKKLKRKEAKDAKAGIVWSIKKKKRLRQLIKKTKVIQSGVYVDVPTYTVVAQKVVVQMIEEKREKRTHANGDFSFGDWQTVRQWVEEQKVKK